MYKRKKMIVFTGTVLILLVLAASLFHVHSLGYGADADLLWNKQDAYLFVSVTQEGWRLSYLDYIRALVKGYLRIPVSATDRVSHILIFTITPEEVQSYSIADQPYSTYVPLGNAIYANKRGILMKWTGNGFESASKDDQQGVKAAPLSPEFTDINGWSKRQAVLSRLEEKTRFPLRLADQTVTLVVMRNSMTDEVTVNLLRPGQDTKEIWKISKRPQRVSKAEYTQLFQKSE